MLKGVDLAYRHRLGCPWIFRKLTLQIFPGERVGLVGPSGIGKSTLARVMAGYVFPQHGSVQISGVPLPTKGTCPVQMLFQHPELAVNPRWKCRDILDEAQALHSELFCQLAIKEEWLERYPHELSGGELQRICLVRALGQETSYLVCDEMTSMVDALTQATIWKTILSVTAKRKIGMLVISHDQVLLNKLCHRLVYCEKENAGNAMQLVSREESFHCLQ